MGETIKDIEVIAYKGMESDMTCEGFYYEIGKSYKTDKVELCEYGFPACLNPTDVLEYYPQNKGSRYFKVKLSGEIAKCGYFDTQVAATEITILEEINIDEVIETTEWWKNDNVLDLLYFSDGFARVQRGDSEWNFINKQGKYLSEQWFNWVDTFYDGFARVERANIDWNFIDRQGNYLSDEWFNWVGYFYDGFARVQRSDNLYNLIDKNSKLISDEWFDFVCDFRYGFAFVQRTNGELCKIDKTGKLIKD